MLYRRPYKVRRAAQGGKEITIAPSVPMRAGEEVVQFFDGFVLVVPRGAVVDEGMLLRAIRLPAADGKRDGQKRS
jgi:hypothetical protein